MKNPEYKVKAFLESEKGKMWIKSMPDYIKPELQAQAENLIKRLLIDFAEYK